jgi:multidrug efflux pump subunit AcrA (membrane-fusion protein)
MTLKRLQTATALVLGAPTFASLLLVVASPGAASAGDKAPAPPKPALTVTAERPAPATLPVRLGANGNVAAWQEALIGSESGGLRLAEVQVNVGDIVSRGQVLAVFASDTVGADVDQARAASPRPGPRWRSRSCGSNTRGWWRPTAA